MYEQLQQQLQQQQQILEAIRAESQAFQAESAQWKAASEFWKNEHDRQRHNMVQSHAQWSLVDRRKNLLIRESSSFVVVVVVSTCRYTYSHNRQSSCHGPRPKQRRCLHRKTCRLLLLLLLLQLQQQ